MNHAIVSQPSLPTVPAPLPRRVKWLFWVMCGALSVFLAEVVSTASPFPFFNAWGLLVVCPLYTLHVLALASLVFGRKRVTFTSLFLAGAILGLYEAYMTKVLWSPTWSPEISVVVGGVHIIHTIILVLFWHPFMAFMLPLMAAETLLTDSRETIAALPDFLQRGLRSNPGRVLLVSGFALYCGFYHSVSGLNVGTSLLSAAGALGVLTILGLIWQRARRNYTITLRDALPSRREAIVLGFLLLAGYIWLGIILRPEAMPTNLGPHAIIWVLYALLFSLLFFSLKHAAPMAMTDPILRQAVPVKIALLFGVVFILATLPGASFLAPLVLLIVLISWLAGCGVGLWLLGRAIVVTFSRAGASYASSD